MTADASSGTSAPRHVVVVGAGMVGLATAWFLQEHAVKVTVIDGGGVAAGASWGNAGWLTPGMSTPLPEPAVLKYGIRAVVSPSSPVYVPPTLNPRLLRFLAGFTLHSTARQWNSGMRALVPICRLALESFDRLVSGGVEATIRDQRPLLAAFRTSAESRGLLEEFAHIGAAGRDVAYEVLTGDQARAIEPSLSEAIGTAVSIHGQRYIDPGTFAGALADSVRARGGTIRAGATVTGVRDDGGSVTVTAATSGANGDAPHLECDAVVLATGARLGDLARRFGVRRIVQAGRGYSFSVPFENLPAGPLYFPASRVACTPIGDRVRVAGMMEFRPDGAALDPRRIRAITEAVRPLLRGADLDDRRDEWVGSRPCTADGLPLIGRTRSPRVFTAGGHGMWGVTLGPATGRLLAAQIATGERPEELAAFDPLR
jgi:D-amino-acid dehydrogenase